MTYAFYSNSIESTLNSINGVLKAFVSLLENKAFVVFKPFLVQVSTLNSFFF